MGGFINGQISTTHLILKKEREKSTNYSSSSRLQQERFWVTSHWAASSTNKNQILLVPRRARSAIWCISLDDVGIWRVDAWSLDRKILQIIFGSLHINNGGNRVSTKHRKPNLHLGTTDKKYLAYRTSFSNTERNRWTGKHTDPPLRVRVLGFKSHLSHLSPKARLKVKSLY